MIPQKLRHLKSWQKIAGATLVAAVLASTLYPKSKDKPNIILILADDMGYSDLSSFGSEIPTPNIDRLGSEGVSYTQFYNAARCNPTRSSLLTGVYPQQAGVGFGVNLDLPAYQGHLSRETPTIAEVLKAGGYRTLMSGKWHLGDNRPDWPVDRGFDRFYGLLGGAGSFWEVLPGKDYRLALDDQLWNPPEDSDFYFTDAITDYAIDFIEEAETKNDPFFLYLSYTAPHWPMHARPEDIAKYRGKYMKGWDVLREERYQRQLELGIVDPSTPLAPREAGVPAWDSLSPEEKDHNDLLMSVYAAMMDSMDQGIGRVMDKLTELGYDENTLVIFLSDNGGCEQAPNTSTAGSDPSIPPGPKGGFWGYGPPWANASNTPYRKYKRYIHEGGIATPLLCRWPAGISATGSVNRQPGHIIDIMSTLLDVTDVEYPNDGSSATEGLSFASTFESIPRPEHEYIYWEHTGNRGVRAGDWKIVSGRTGPWELYDIAKDRNELHDLAKSYPKIVKDLSDRWQKWADEVGVIPWSEVNRLRNERKEN